MRATHNLFAGRQAAMHTLQQWRDAGARLITITGPGGMGKTRLALEALRGVSAAVRVDLSAARVDTDVTAAVGSALGMRTLPGRDGHDAVEAALLARGGTTVLLDNAEQVVDAVATLVARWGARAPDIRWLVTSRERLRLPDEHVLPLEGLSPLDAAAILEDRARQHRPGFALRPADTDVVHALVSGLDGLPLAVELAAARLSLMDVRELAERLSAQTAPLASKVRGTPTRHVSLKDAFAWSWDLLGAAERDALAQCSVFAGAFRLEDAVAVMASGPGAPSADQVAALLEALHDKSLLTRVDAPGGVRLRLLVSIRTFAAQHQPPGSVDRHRAHLLRVARQHAPRADGRVEEPSLLALEEARADLLALARDGSAPPRQALAAALGLEPLLALTGPMDALQQLLDGALQRAGAEKLEADLLTRTHLALGRVRLHRQGVEASVAQLQEALVAAAPGVDALLRAQVLLELGSVIRRTGDMPRAQGLLLEAESLVPRTQRWLWGRVQNQLGILLKESQQMAQARVRYQDALAALRSAGDPHAEARVLDDLGALHQEEGRLLEARECFENALRLLRDSRHVRTLALVLSDLGSLELEEKRPAEAEVHLRACVDLLEGLADRRTAALYGGVLAAACAAQDRVEESAERFLTSERVLTALGATLHASAVAAQRGHLHLARARAARRATPPGDGDAHIRDARQCLADAAATAGLSDDVRLAERLLRAALAEFSGPRLRVGPQCAWMEGPGHARVNLLDRPTVRRLVALLVDARERSPGSALDMDALIAGGWPGERILPEAAQNRLHVTLGTLRKLGLRDVLLKVDGGWTLDPAVELQRQPAGA